MMATLQAKLCMHALQHMANTNANWFAATDAVCYPTPVVRSGEWLVCEERPPTAAHKPRMTDPVKLHSMKQTAAKGNPVGVRMANPNLPDNPSTMAGYLNLHHTPALCGYLEDSPINMHHRRRDVCCPTGSNGSTLAWEGKFQVLLFDRLFFHLLPRKQEDNDTNFGPSFETNLYNKNGRLGLPLIGLLRHYIHNSSTVAKHKLICALIYD
jgi:hypothetical protein